VALSSIILTFCFIEELAIRLEVTRCLFCFVAVMADIRRKLLPVFLPFQTRCLFKGLSRHLFESGHYRKSGIVFGSHMNNSSCLFMPH